MRSFEHYKHRLGQAAEDALTQYAPGSKKPAELLSIFTDSKESKFNRTVALLSLVRDLIPIARDSQKNLKFFRDISELPVSPQAYDFKDKIGSGGESNVYLLESNEPEKKESVVFKINYCRHGGVTELAEQAKVHRQEYEKIRGIYSDVPDVVPDEAVIIAKDVHKFFYKEGKPAIVTIQKFFGGEIRDIFSEISFEELKQLTAQEPEFAETLRKFTADSFRHEAQTGEVVDFLGPKNLSVIKAGNSHKLVLLDPHVIYSSRSGVKEIDERLHKGLEYLKTIVQEIGKGVVVPNAGDSHI